MAIETAIERLRELACVTGGFTGPPSKHWRSLAEQLEASAARSSLKEVKQWARDAVKKLRKMSAADLEREAEERLTWG